MRGHALVLLVIVALVSPATRAVGRTSTASVQQVAVSNVVTANDAALQPGLQLIRRGDYASAEGFFDDVASQNGALAPRALLLQARAALADGDTSSAETIVQHVLDAYPDSDQVANAY